MTEFSTWIEEHLYVPILVGLAILALVMGAIYCLCRRNRFKGSYYVYKRLEHEAEMAQQQDREREMQQDVIRDTAYMNCQYYLRSHPNYRLLEQLKDLAWSQTVTRCLQVPMKTR